MVIQAQKLILLSQSRSAEILLPDILSMYERLGTSQGGSPPAPSLSFLPGPVKLGMNL